MSLEAFWVKLRDGTQFSLPAGYDRRKYVWKLLYIYMLGYDIDFGHKQAADLIPTSKCAGGRQWEQCRKDLARVSGSFSNTSQGHASDD